MARDAIGLKGIDYEDDKKIIPIPSEADRAIDKAKENAEIFDYSVGVLTLVDVDFEEYRRRMDNKAVRRNVTLPNWLNVEAEKAQINVSRVLQEALMNVRNQPMVFRAENRLLCCLQQYILLLRVQRIE